MPVNTFAGDRSLALKATLMPNQRPEKLIGFLNLTQQCFSPDTVITADLNQIRLLFPGVLRDVNDSEKKEGERKIERRTLLSTTSRGNSWSISSPYELLVPNPQQLMEKFVDGNEPVIMGSLITGRFRSSFPDGIVVENVETSGESPDESEEVKDEKKKRKKLRA